MVYIVECMMPNPNINLKIKFYMCDVRLTVIVIYEYTKEIEKGHQLSLIGLVQF